jgi:tetratricopeptide (TPR) repeat protein
MSKTKPHGRGHLAGLVLLKELEVALLQRDTRTAFPLLDRAFAAGVTPDLSQSGGAALLLHIAQLVDLGYRDLDFLDSFFLSPAAVDRGQLCTLDFFKLRMAEAYRDLAGERLEKAIDALDLVLRAGEDLLGNYLMFLAHFWKGRAHRKRGDYERALLHITAARNAATRADAPKLIAVAKIHESWLQFQKGDRHQALQLLDEAEAELKPTGHALSLGNIESARGRFVRRSGEYAQALKHFENAITIYRDNFPNHPNLARALVNAAYVKRLMALNLQPRSGGHAKGATHNKSLKMSHEALELLEQASKIYALHHHQGGTGSMLVNAAHLHLESGNIDQAALESQRAFTLGEEHHDKILMARAKIALAAVELARSEEQLGDQPDIALHAQLAVDHSETAIELGKHTQNKRLLAGGYIARGMAAANDYFQDWETAKQYAAMASALLGHGDRDHLYRVLSDLKVKLTGPGHVEEALRLWSDGQLGNRTFQQVQEDFAELVIPKVWLRAGKNISLVAKDLSMSPKKVRRILRNAKYEEK